MKLVHQLVELLHSRGELSRTAIVNLVRRGFLDDSWLPDGDWTEPAYTDTVDDAHDAWRERLERRAPRGKAGRRPAAPAAEVRELCAELAARFPAWDAELATLTGLGRELAGAESWRESAEAVRHHGADALADRLAGLLQGRCVDAGDVWALLRFDSYRLGPGVYRGGAATGYRALISGEDVPNLARYRWVLGHEELASVFHLVQAQRRVQQAAGRLFARQPGLLMPRERKSYADTPGCFPEAPVLVLLAAARSLQAPGSRDADPATVPFPTGVPGGPRYWRDAWALALLLDEVAVTPLFVQCLRCPFVRLPLGALPEEVLALALRHQPGWMWPGGRPGDPRALLERKPCLLDWGFDPAGWTFDRWEPSCLDSSAWAAALRELQCGGRSLVGALGAVRASLAHPLREAGPELDKGVDATLAILGSESADCVPLYLTMLEESYAAEVPPEEKRIQTLLRHRLVELLGRIGKGAPEVLAALQRALADESPAVRDEAARALAQQTAGRKA